MQKIANGIHDPNIFKSVYEYSQGIDLTKLGHFSGLDSGILIPEQRDEYCRFLVSSALFRGMGGGQTPTALAIREISPSLDFTDSNNRPIQSDLWMQEFDTTKMYESMQSIYIASRASRLHQKTILLYGVYIPTSFTNISEIQIWRKGVKLIDRLYTNGHKPGPKKLNTPVLLWTHSDDGNESYEIKAKFEFGPMLVDNIRLLGYVCEALGVNTIA